MAQAETMSSLPAANAEITRFFRQWLETFSGYVRDVDYASAKPLFHPDVLAFGTHNDVIPGLDQWGRAQWEKCWPRNTRFPFLPEPALVAATPERQMATVIAPWTS